MGKIRVIRESNLRNYNTSENNKVYPVTTSDAVYVPEKGILTPILTDLKDKIDYKNIGWEEPVEELQKNVVKLQDGKVGYLSINNNGSSYHLYGFKDYNDYKLWYDYQNMDSQEFVDKYHKDYTEEQINSLVMQQSYFSVQDTTDNIRYRIGNSGANVKLGTYTNEQQLENALLNRIQDYALYGAYQSYVLMDSYGVGQRIYKYVNNHYVDTDAKYITGARGYVEGHEVNYEVNYEVAPFYSGNPPVGGTIMEGTPNYYIKAYKYKNKEIYVGYANFDWGNKEFTSFEWTPLTEQKAIKQELTSLSNLLTSLSNEIETIRQAGGLTEEEKESLVAEVINVVMTSFPNDYTSLSQLDAAVSNIRTQISNINNSISNLDNSKASKTELAQTKTDIENHYNEVIELLDTKVDGFIESLTGYATKNFVNSAVEELTNGPIADLQSSVNTINATITNLRDRVISLENNNSHVCVLELDNMKYKDFMDIENKVISLYKSDDYKVFNIKYIIHSRMIGFLDQIKYYAITVVNNGNYLLLQGDSPINKEPGFYIGTYDHLPYAEPVREDTEEDGFWWYDILDKPKYENQQTLTLLDSYYTKDEINDQMEGIVGIIDTLKKKTINDILISIANIEANINNIDNRVAALEYIWTPIKK